MNFFKHLFGFGKSKDHQEKEKTLQPKRHSKVTQNTLLTQSPATKSPGTSHSKERLRRRKSRQREIKREEAPSKEEVKKEDIQRSTDEPATKKTVLMTVTEPETVKPEVKNEGDKVPKRPKIKIPHANSEDAHTDFEQVAVPSRPAISRSGNRYMKKFMVLGGSKDQSVVSKETMTSKEPLTTKTFTETLTSKEPLSMKTQETVTSMETVVVNRETQDRTQETVDSKESLDMKADSKESIERHPKMNDSSLIQETQEMTDSTRDDSVEK